MMSQPTYKLLFMSTGVGALGSGLGGGIEVTLPNIVKAMQQRGHTIDIVAPAGSRSGSLPLIEIPGNTQNAAQDQKYDAEIGIPTNSVLANMWSYAYQVQGNYDLILNFSYDRLPLYLTQFFPRPVAHLISMSSLLDAMDDMIAKVATQFPHAIGVHSKTQAATFPCPDECVCLFNGKTGFLVEPDSVQGLIDAVKRVHTIDRQNCRQQAESLYSLAAMGARVEQWFEKILHR